MQPFSHRLRVLGQPALLEADGSRADLSLGKPFGLLCFLALTEGPVTRDDLARLLWSGAAQERARQSVRQGLWLIRKATSDDFVDVDGERVELPPGRLEIDLDHFREALSSGDFGRAAELWGDGLFAGFTIPNAPNWNYWADELRSGLEDHFVGALRDRALADLDAGRPEEALGWLQTALEVRPYDGRSQALQIEILLATHRLQEAEEALLRARASAEAGAESLEPLEERLRHLRRDRYQDLEPSLSTELVGRSDAFARLTSTWRSARSGRPRLVALTGPPGIGKTRLAEELAEFVRLGGARVVSTQGIHAERGMPWSVTADLVRQLYRLPGAAGVDRHSNGVLRSLVPTLGGGHEDVTSVPSDVEPAPLADAVADLVAAVAHEHPLLVLADDLQWMDPPSRALLSHLTRALSGSPVLLLVTCRTGEDEELIESLRLQEHRSEATVISLDPLATSDLEEMLGLLGTFEEKEDLDRLAEEIQRLTGGNPLFVVELLRSLEGRGLIRRADRARWVFTGGIGTAELELPETLRQSLLEQIGTLSTPARRVARLLAERPQGVTPGDLVALSVADTEQVESSVRSLLARGMARQRWDGRIEIAHEEIREAILDDVDRADEIPPKPARARILLVAATLIVLIGGVSWGVVSGAGSAGEPPPWGGGVLLTQNQEGLTTLTPKSADAWDREPSLRHPDGGRLQGVSWTPSGTALQAVGYVARPDAAPAAVFVGADGAIDTIYASSGDVSGLGLDPRGRHAVLAVADTRLEAYQIDIVRMELDTPEGGDTTHLLAHPHVGYDRPTWTPDGRLLALTRNTPHDSLVVLRPDGTRVATFGLPDPDLYAPSWCGSSGRLLVSSLEPGAGPRIWELDVASGTVELVPTTATMTRIGVACSPDGSGMVYSARVEDGSRLVLQRRADGALHTLPHSDPVIVTWLPDPPGPLPNRVDLPDSIVSLGWGERRKIEPRVLDQTGRAMDSVDLVWSSRDPRVVSVLSGGILSGNGRGLTYVIAKAEGWIRDSVAVRVQGEPGPTVVWSDPLRRLDTTRWATVGVPEPRGVATEEDSALWMAGDGVYTDGMISRRSFSLPRGGTVQLDVRIPLTRTDRQEVTLCLTETGPEHASPGGAPVPPGRYVCMAYPAGEGVDFDPSEFQFGSSAQTTGPRRLPGILPSDGWTTFAIQLRADGRASLFLNGRHAQSLELPVENDRDTEWHVRILGRSVDTRVLVRDLVVWGEQRYALEGSRPRP